MTLRYTAYRSFLCQSDNLRQRVMFRWDGNNEICIADNGELVGTRRNCLVFSCILHVKKMYNMTRVEPKRGKSLLRIFRSGSE